MNKITWKKIGIGLAGFALLAGALACSGKTGSPSGTGSSAPRAVATTAVPAAVESPAAPKPPTVTEQMSTWFNGGGHDRLTAVSNALEEVSRTSLAGDIKGAKMAAVGLGVAVKAAQAYPSMPDNQAQLYWGQALNDLAAASQNYYVGLTTGDTGSIQKATNEIVDANAKISLCNKRITALIGS